MGWKDRIFQKQDTDQAQEVDSAYADLPDVPDESDTRSSEKGQKPNKKQSRAEQAATAAAADPVNASLRRTLKLYRWAILTYCFVLALLSTLASSFLPMLGSVWFGLIGSSIVVLYFFLKANTLTKDLVSGHDPGKAGIFSKVQISKRAFAAFALFLAMGFLSFALIAWVIPKTNLGILVLILVLLGFGVAVAVATVFLDMEGHYLQDLKDSFSFVWKHKKHVAQFLYRFLMIAFRGILLIVLVNIFAYGPQLQPLLASGTATNADIMHYFTNDGATFIQTVGTQCIVFYTIFVGMLMFRIARREALIQKSGKKGKKGKK